MKTWYIWAASGTFAVVIGTSDLLTGRGSLALGIRPTTTDGVDMLHYAGIAAYIEGVVLIAAGAYCLAVARRKIAGGDDPR